MIIRILAMVAIAMTTIGCGDGYFDVSPTQVLEVVDNDISVIDRAAKCYDPTKLIFNDDGTVTGTAEVECIENIFNVPVTHVYENIDISHITGDDTKLVSLNHVMNNPTSYINSHPVALLVTPRYAYSNGFWIVTGKGKPTVYMDQDGGIDILNINKDDLDIDGDHIDLYHKYIAEVEVKEYKISRGEHERGEIKMKILRLWKYVKPEDASTE